MLTFIKNPRKGWKQDKGQKKKVMGNILDEEMMEYVTKLYNHANAIEMGNETM